MNVKQKKPKADYLVAIIGAGFSGLGMAIKLLKADFTSFIIVESSNEVGGTWRDSKYPGAAVDVPTHLYSYSFEQSPNWKRMFAKQDEIQQYILDLTKKYNLRPYIKFNTKVENAQYLQDNGFWQISTDSLGKVTANIVISAAGPFAHESIPNLPGLNQFKGETVHTAKWNSKLNFKNKTVAVVGSGASAIQVVPALAPKVKELKVFQRTPPWIVPKTDYEFSELEKTIYRYFPAFQKVRRAIIYGLTEVLATAIVWDTPVTSLLEYIAKKNIEKSISDPILRERVTPKYRLGGIRMLISNDWYPTLTKKNVELIDHKVESVTQDGLVANGKEYNVDIIVWATGYKSPAQGCAVDLKGRDGVDLATLWKKGVEAFRGVAIAGFPNFFTLMGPNTGPGHTSVLVYVEAQQDYIVKALKSFVSKGLKSLEVTKDAQQKFNEEIDKKMKRTTWGKGGESWYYTKDGRNTLLYPGFATEYVQSMANFISSDYTLEK